MTDHPGQIAVFVSFSGHGGVERMIVNLVRGLVDLGRAVDLLPIRRQSPHLERLPTSVRCLPMGSGHALLAVPALAAYLRRERPAALLAAKDRAGRAAVLARAIAGTETPIVLRLGTHLSTAMAGKSALQRALRYAPIRRLYPHLERIVAVSEGVAADTAAIAGLPRARITVIRNPVITPDLPAQAAAPCPHPWLEPGGPPVVVGAGRLARQKDFPTLLRAFARVRAQRPCRLIILGEGQDRPALEALAGALGIAADLDLPGFQANPYPFMVRARLFVLSSAWEGSPNVLTEAMALGTPVVSTDCPSGPAELLDQGRFGALVPVGDAAALAEAMAATLAAPLPAATLRGAVAEYDQAIAARRYLAALGLADDPAHPT
jgi:glycosyltransferase involved in cell wall biosynthesis